MPGKAFENLDVDSLEKLSLDSDYIMSINLSSAELHERFGIEFTELAESNKVLTAAIKDPSTGFIFEFESRTVLDKTTTSVSVRGKDLDLRDAYTAFTQVFKLKGTEIAWISGSI